MAFSSSRSSPWLEIRRWMLDVGCWMFSLSHKKEQGPPLFLPFREPTPNVFASQWSNLAYHYFARSQRCARIFSARRSLQMLVRFGRRGDTDSSVASSDHPAHVVLFSAIIMHNTNT